MPSRVNRNNNPNNELVIAHDDLNSVFTRVIVESLTSFAYSTRPIGEVFSNEQKQEITVYGVPLDLDLSDYLNARCTQIAISESHLFIRFHPDAEISVDGRWEIRDTQGSIVDHSMANEKRKVSRLHVLLGQEVVDAHVDAPISFSLTFKNEYRFTIVDESEKYETCQLSPSGVII